MEPTHMPDLLHRIEMEFMEMPGLNVTLSQAGRLWNLPTDLCAQVLATLVEREFLSRTDEGAFLRRSSDAARRTQKVLSLQSPE